MSKPKRRVLNLAQRDAQIVEYTLKGYTLTEIAKAMGIDRITVWRRLQTAKVQGLLDEARRELFRHTGYAVVAAHNEAIAYLRHVIAGEEQGDPVRVKAAQALLSHSAFQALALEDVRRELEKVRKLLEGSTPIPVKEQDHGRALASPRKDGETQAGSGELVVESDP